MQIKEKKPKKQITVTTELYKFLHNTNQGETKSEPLIHY